MEAVADQGFSRAGGANSKRSYNFGIPIVDKPTKSSKLSGFFAY